MSPNSRSKHSNSVGSFNERTVVINIYGPFSGYNSSIISNGNDINLYIYGYYGGYGMRLHCNQSDICQENCYGDYNKRR